MTSPEVEELAAAVVERLQTDILKLPAEVTKELKPWAGWTTRTHISGNSAWPFLLETVITSDGGLRVAVMSPNGRYLFERTLHA